MSNDPTSGPVPGLVPGPGAPAVSPRTGVPEQQQGNDPVPALPAPSEGQEFAGPRAPLVLDASFVLAVLQRDPRTTELLDCLPGSVLLSVNLGEVFYKVYEKSGLAPTQVEPVLRAFGVDLVDLPAAAARHFPALRAIDRAARTSAKAAGAKAGNLSLADVSVLGYARETGLPVLTGDRHWTNLRDHGLDVVVHLY